MNPCIDQTSLNHKNLNQIESTEMLGVVIDSRLSFQVHTKHIASKISKSSGVLYSIKSF